MENIATKESWKNTPIDTPKRIDISKIVPDLDLSFSEEQLLKIKNGLIPQEMEDKWFIYYENDWLFFHRSWTGYGIYRAKIVKKKNNSNNRDYAIKDFYVERNKKYYNHENEEYELDVLLQLIVWGLLKLDVRNYFFNKYGSGVQGSIKMWSEFGRLIFTENDVGKRSIISK